MTPPPRRPLGRSGLSVAPVAFGGNVFGWTVDEPRAFELLDTFVEAGYNLVDTADVYSTWVPGHKGGESETILGKWLHERGRRKEVLLATKVGMEMPNGEKGLSPAHITKSADGSLGRLQTDSIDLYQAHQDDRSTPMAETLGAFNALIDAGKVRAIGASNFEPDRLQDALLTSTAHGFARYESLQPRYNLLDRPEFEGMLGSVCRANGLGVITYSSLGSGFLTGKYRTKADLAKSPRGARAEARLNEKGHRILAALDDVASRYRTPVASVALAWLLARPGVTAPIASATSVDQLHEILAAATLHLDADAIRVLDTASASAAPRS